MAFGFGFNKQKVLSAAEKFVQQGKLQSAIAEYEKIRKHDSKDLTVANTIGDLYARLGDTSKAIECFKAVGDAYAAQGFTVKGIAMYKKITKLQPSMDGSLKLAELYTQQGLFNDARAQYLQVAEELMKSGELEQAVRLFQKVLEMDPENVPMRVKIAEVYVKLNKKKEAWDIFSAAAESLRARGSLSAAEEILQRMLQIDPNNSYVLLLRGRAALESDDPKMAIQYLEKAADLDSHPEGLRDLLKAYLEIGDVAKCAPLAEKLLSVHNDPEGLFLLGEGTARLGQYDDALEIYRKHADRLLATDSTKLLASLHTMIAHVQDNPAALEGLLDLLKKSGESTHVNEVAELLAHASVKNGNLERARDLYQMLAANEPQNELHAQNLAKIDGKLQGTTSAAPHAITAEEGTLIVDELEATAPVVDQTYPEQIAISVRAAVTDADLFLSYNLPDKALAPLLSALPQAPRDVRINQRLAALHTRSQRFADAAACCRTLESVYRDAGCPDDALRYGELASRYEQNGAASATQAGAKMPAVQDLPVTTTSHPEFSIDAMAPDLSSDLQSDAIGTPASFEDEVPVDLETPALAHAQPPGSGDGDAEITETVDEIRFYLEHFMVEQARTAFERLQTLTHDAAVLDPLRAAIESDGKSSEESEVEIAEINADDPASFEIDLSTASAEGEEAAAEPAAEEFHIPIDVPHAAPEEAASAIAELPVQAHHEPAEHAAEDFAVAPQAEVAHAATNELSNLVADLEQSLGDFPVAPPAAEVSAPEHELTPAAPAASSVRSAAKSGAAANMAAAMATPTVPAATHPEVDLTSKLSVPEPTPEPMPNVLAAAAAASNISHDLPPSPAAAASQSAAGVDLTEMFGELKQELEEEKTSVEDDPETHYNLGVAFREMGLLDEAIAELQKVATSMEHGRAFSQPVQTYTWLAQCFLDKGVPEAAVNWFERALKIPNLDSETKVAINYELGSACESAKDKPAALRHFTYVYGANIDYRDVAERIQALKS